ncbi:DUF465 domain-containing protein [Pelovirga terrestris]|uniref:YdcH family protein n=1 Tax=Pelovirga terrestris TaxID=2771352 RepID=A0A8J6UIH4_9BACT|nr:DUF465 domain-containing protein [Pelovirga terrestris]MBD1400950.1 YdcH family protein [Pelovirga terrestris]
MDIDQTLLQSLIDNNPRFRMLYENHNLLEKQLQEFEKRPFLSADEEIEKNKVKKLKLIGKDEMETIVQSVTV